MHRSLNGTSRSIPALTDGYRGGEQNYLPSGYTMEQWQNDVRMWEQSTGLNYEQYTRAMEQQQQRPGTSGRPAALPARSSAGQYNQQPVQQYGASQYGQQPQYGAPQYSQQPQYGMPPQQRPVQQQPMDPRFRPAAAPQADPRFRQAAPGGMPPATPNRQPSAMPMQQPMQGQQQPQGWPAGPAPASQPPQPAAPQQPAAPAAEASGRRMDEWIVREEARPRMQEVLMEGAGNGQPQAATGQRRAEGSGWDGYLPGQGAGQQGMQ